MCSCVLVEAGSAAASVVSIELSALLVLRIIAALAPRVGDAAMTPVIAPRVMTRGEADGRRRRRRRTKMKQAAIAQTSGAIPTRGIPIRRPVVRVKVIAEGA